MIKMIDTAIVPKSFFRIKVFEYFPGDKVQSSKLEKLSMSLVKKGECLC